MAEQVDPEELAHLANNDPDPEEREFYAREYAARFGGDQVPVEVPLRGPPSQEPAGPAAKEQSGLDQFLGGGRATLTGVAKGLASGLMANRRPRLEAQLKSLEGARDPLGVAMANRARKDMARLDETEAFEKANAGSWKDYAGQFAGAAVGLGAGAGGAAATALKAGGAGPAASEIAGNMLGGGLESATRAAGRGADFKEASEETGLGALLSGGASGVLSAVRSGLHGVSPWIARRLAAEGSGAADRVGGGGMNTKGGTGYEGVEEQAHQGLQRILRQNKNLNASTQAEADALTSQLPGIDDMDQMPDLHENLDAGISRAPGNNIPTREGAQARVNAIKRKTTNVTGQKLVPVREHQVKTDVVPIIDETIPRGRGRDIEIREITGYEPDFYRSGKAPSDGRPLRGDLLRQSRSDPEMAERLYRDDPTRQNVSRLDPGEEIEGPATTPRYLTELRANERADSGFGTRSPTAENLDARKAYFALSEAAKKRMPGLKPIDAMRHRRLAQSRREMALLTGNEKGMRPSDAPADFGNPDELAAAEALPEGPKAEAEIKGQPSEEEAAIRRLAIAGDSSVPALNKNRHLQELASADPEYAAAIKDIETKKAIEATRLLTLSDPVGRTLSQMPGMGDSLNWAQRFGGQAGRAIGSKIDRYGIPAGLRLAPTLTNPVDALLERLRRQQEENTQ